MVATTLPTLVPAVDPAREHAIGLRRATPHPVLVALLFAIPATMAATGRDFGADAPFLPYKGLALFLACLIPSLLYCHQCRTRPERAEPLPFLPLLGLIYGVYFAFPVLFRDEVLFMSLEPPPAFIERAVTLVLVGWLSLLVGAYMVGPKLIPSKGIELHMESKRALGMAGTLLGVGFAAEIFGDILPIPGSLRQVVRFLQMLTQVGMGILVVEGFRGNLPKRSLMLLWWVLVPIFMLLRLRGGAIGNAIPAAVFLLFLVRAYRYRLPWGLMGVGLCGLILLRGAAPEYRLRLKNRVEVQELSAMDRSLLYGSILRESLEERGMEAVEESGELFLQRLSQVALFAHVAYRTPNVTPYWHGESYKTLPSSVIPRFFWPNKPSKNIGQRFGHRYGVLDPGDTRTSINLPQVVEFYVNFGTWGVVFGMFALGLFYRFMNARFNQPFVGDGGLLIGATLFSKIAQVESDLSLVFGDLLQTGVILYFVIRACSAKEAPVQVSSPTPRGPGPRSQLAAATYAPRLTPGPRTAGS